MKKIKKLKVMQLSKQYFRILGINIGKTPARQIDLRTLTAILVFVLGDISTANYVLFKSKTFMEYIVASYLFCGVLVCLLVDPYVVWRIPDLFKFIESE